ncbi:phage tail assembly protein [Exiguobacterium sp. SH5S4]|uniref:phage tail assembly protein n=1 Tax=Exiguobacterium sp. SH5S4 TaxID=2510961 RepID=UPI00103E2205|nr:phage tail assembly protein [Exiguobacterium sp. SH5S4]TCI25573.1 phage tail assembly protein [Exiguobacterium sp. SH5S4]
MDAKTNEQTEAVNVESKKQAEGIVKFKKPYSFEGQTYQSVDLSGIDDLTGDDLLEADRAYTASGQFSPLPEMTLAYAFSIAATVTKQPIEFYRSLPAKEGLKVKNEVIRFLNN